jgi:hypothetical protein
MDDPNLTPPPEAPRDPIEIRDEDAITIDEALLIANENAYPLGKSTLQRWSKFWEERRGPVRSILVTHAAGKFYKLSRDDFQSWVFDRKQNARPLEAPEDLSRSHETLRDLKRPRETSPETDESANRIKELENENLNLKIDLSARKQLIELVQKEINNVRSEQQSLLREMGGLEFQLRQLPKPPSFDTYPHHAGGAAQ